MKISNARLTYTASLMVQVVPLMKKKVKVVKRATPNRWASGQVDGEQEKAVSRARARSRPSACFAVNSLPNRLYRLVTYEYSGWYARRNGFRSVN